MRTGINCVNCLAYLPITAKPLRHWSERFRQLESQAGELADTIAVTSQRIKNVGSDTRNIEAFTQAVQGVAAGFQLAQGAAGLFGQETELELELAGLADDLANFLQHLTPTYKSL